MKLQDGVAQRAVGPDHKTALLRKCVGRVVPNPMSS